MITMAAKSKGVTIGVFASSSMRDKENGQRFLQLLMNAAPDYAPVKYNDFEPIKLSFDPANLDEALKCWGIDRSPIRSRRTARYEAIEATAATRE